MAAAIRVRDLEKTTFSNVLVGLVRTSGGEASVFGYDVVNKSSCCVSIFINVFSLKSIPSFLMALVITLDTWLFRRGYGIVD